MQQCANVHEATHQQGSRRGHIAYLRTPFCLAYVKTPPRYRESKHAAQAEACVHLGFSRSKPGYVLEVLEGPRKGRVITSAQVKFRENMYPLKEGYRPKDNLVELGLWHDLDWDMKFQW